jgi:glycosyltransferase involved in cell wall biosynthesis
MKIFYLYSELLGYTMATIQALVNSGAEVHVVHWDHKKLTAYEPPAMDGAHFYNRSELTVEAMHSLGKRLSPDITVVSGWMDNGYLSVAKVLRKRKHTVALAIDGQWRSTPRQLVASLAGSMGYFSRYFSHAWVAGTYQYEYARKLGFDKKHIIYDLYSADIELFNQAYKAATDQKETCYPHRFLFVGRFEHIKGLDVLMAAWASLALVRIDWELHLVGDGSLKDMLAGMPDVFLKPFMQPAQLIKEVKQAGCFVLPSRGEPWGVVVHEFTAAGLPLIASNEVGAAAAFLINDFNGFTFAANDSEALAKEMLKIIETSDEDLTLMAQRSHQLAQKITPETSAANLLSIGCASDSGC